MWVVISTLPPLYPQEWPGTHCTRDCVGPMAGVDGCGKSRPHWDSMPGPSVSCYYITLDYNLRILIYHFHWYIFLFNKLTKHWIHYWNTDIKNVEQVTLDETYYKRCLLSPQQRTWDINYKSLHNKPWPFPLYSTFCHPSLVCGLQNAMYGALVHMRHPSVIWPSH